MRLQFLLKTLLVFLSLAAPAKAGLVRPPGAEIRVLSVGINNYAASSVPDLTGAVNDVRDIQQAFQKIGVTDFTLLLDADATRSKLTAAMAQLIARTRKDDIVVLTFAASSVQELERVKGSESDGRDEVVLLHHFNPKAPASARGTPAFTDRIYDDEFNTWIGLLGQAGAKVIFIADFCHSGTATRGFGPDETPRTSPPLPQGGTQPYYTVTPDMLDGIPPPIQGPESDHTHLTLISASQDSEIIPEILIEDAKRGALSYAFARAVEGQADSNNDGMLTRRELYRYVRQKTRELVQSQQTPNFEPSDPSRLDDIVLILKNSTSAPAPESVALYVDGRAPAAQILTSLIDDKFVAMADRRDGADLIWDVANRRMVSGQDVIAYDVGLQGSETLRSVVERAWAVKQLIALPRVASEAQARMETAGALYQDESRITFAIENVSNKSIILVSLSGDGMVHWLDSRRRRARPRYDVDLNVTPPFGADMIIAFVSDSEQTDLADKLKDLNGARAANALYQIVRDIDQSETKILFQNIQTSPR